LAYTGLFFNFLAWNPSKLKLIIGPTIYVEAVVGRVLWRLGLLGGVLTPTISQLASM
jgi:hypothetical protein